MKTLNALLLSIGLSSATSLTSRDIFYSDTANDMTMGKCAPAAVIFARGTFDGGNIGVWVGPQLLQPLKEQGIAIQGVDAAQYPADLKGYLKEGGSDSGAKSLAATVTSYAQKCPDSAIVISGWSQGALVAHKGLALLSSAVQKQVAGFITFGDPWHLFGKTSVPSSIPSQSYCITGSAFDPLCANLPSDFKVPTSVSDIITPFKSAPSFAKDVQQAKAAASLIAGFPSQFLKNAGIVAKDLVTGDFMKLLLTPQHFTYGNGGMAQQAATWIVSTPGVKNALKGGSTDTSTGAHSTSKAAVTSALPLSHASAAVKAKARRGISHGYQVQARRDIELGQELLARRFEGSVSSLSSSLSQRNVIGRLVAREVLPYIHRRAIAVKSPKPLFYRHIETGRY